MSSAGKYKDNKHQTDERPKSYKTIGPYVYDPDDVNICLKNKAVKVVVLKSIPEEKEDQAEPQEVSLYFYSRREEHAAEWDLAAKFDTLKNLKKHRAIMTCNLWFRSDMSYIVASDSLSGGSLLDRLQDYSGDLGFDEMDARSVMKQIFSGVDYLHECGIVHRGLWLENFVYRRKGESTIKIADWDCAMQIKNNDQELHFLSDKHLFDNKRPLCSYSPEMIQASLSSKEGYGKPSDLWALGVCLYMICAIRIPINVPESKLHDRKKNYLKIVSQSQIPYRSEDWDRVSKEAKDLVEKLLCVDPRSRITIIGAREHEWITASDLKPADGGGRRDLGLAFASKNSRRK